MGWWWLALALADEPVLQVELGMHTAAIWDIETDAQGRFLVSGSDDKTARVWDGCTGKLLRVLRPPVGEGKVGQVYAVAISPDGATVAVGGWMQDVGGRVFLFDRASGDVRQVLSGLDNVTLALAWSLDGTWLAVGQRSGGLRVFGADGSLAWQDTKVADRLLGLAWNTKGQLAVASYDDRLRLYDHSGELLQDVAAGAADPKRAVWSADGERLAIGYRSGARVELRDGRDLRMLSVLSEGSDENDDLGAVAWTKAGQVAAGGRYDAGVESPVRLLSPDSAPQDLPVGTNTILDLLTMPGRTAACRVPELVVATAEPRLAGVREGVVVQLNTPPILDVRDVDIRLLPTGFAWLGDARHGNPASWRELDLAAGELHVLQAPSPGALKPLREVPGHRVEAWKNTTHPTLDGRPLRLREYEVSNALAWRHDGTSLLLATSWYLRPFSAEGVADQPAPIPNGASEAVWSADDRLLVVAHHDGTFRWYHPDTLTPLLTTFIHRDGRRWVAWTPSGYYIGSPDAEDLFGWHVGRGPDQSADFFSAGHFRDLLYRPDVVRLILQTRDEAAAVAQANARRGIVTRPPDPRLTLPPVVTLLSPEPGAELHEEVALLQLRLRSPSGRPVDQIRVWANGIPVDNPAISPPLDPARVPDNDLHTVRVRVQGATTLLVTARSAGAWSEPAAVHVRGMAGEGLIRSTVHVLAVGIEGFARPAVATEWGLASLRQAEDDAQRFAAHWRTQGVGDRRLYERADVQALTGTAATRAGILDALTALKGRVVQDDVVIVYLSGHGLVPPGDTSHYLVPWDADPQRYASTWLRLDELEHTFDQLPARTLLFFDLCHAGVEGELVAMSKGADHDTQQLVARLSSADHGTVVFSATGRSTRALELPTGGAFTQAVLRCLEDPKTAVDELGGITVDRLGACVVAQTNVLTGGVQKALYKKPGVMEDFPIARPPARLQP